MANTITYFEHTLYYSGAFHRIVFSTYVFILVTRLKLLTSVKIIKNEGVSSLHPTSFLMIFTLVPLIFSTISMANTH